jgi:hypothetical protein
MTEPKFTYIKCSLNRATFTVDKIRDWIEAQCKGKTVLNLFGGITRLRGCDETSNDLNFWFIPAKGADPLKIETTYHMDALECVKMLVAQGKKYQRVVQDPPYSYRKSMEMYQGGLNSRFKQICDLIPQILAPGGKVITFGYHSIVMGEDRGFRVAEICHFAHGGAMRTTIATIEEIEAGDKLDGDTVACVEQPINHVLASNSQQERT